MATYHLREGFGETRANEGAREDAWQAREDEEHLPRVAIGGVWSCEGGGEGGIVAWSQRKARIGLVTGEVDGGGGLRGARRGVGVTG